MANNRYVRLLLIAIPVFLAGLVIYWLSDIVAYILIAWVVSMIGAPIMKILLNNAVIGRFRFNAAVCAILTLLILIGFLAGVGMLFVPIILEQASNLANVDTNAIIEALEEPIRLIIDKLQAMGLVAQEVDPEEQIKAELSKWFEPTKLTGFLGSFVSLASNLMIGIFSVIFISFFFLKEQGLFARLLSNFTPTRIENKVQIAVKDSSDLLTRYFGGIVLQITIISIYLSLLLSIVGVKNALLIAVFAALINVIPYLGPLIGGAFGIMLTITASLDLDFYSQMMPLLVKVAICFMSMQLLDNFVLQPFIFSNRVRAHPLEIFLFIMIGAKVGGIMGMILAIPAYTIIRVVARTFLSEFEIIQKITSGLKSVEKSSDRVV